MTKNFRNILALISMALFVVLAGLSFSVKSEAACSHSTATRVTKAATCTSSGTRQVYCTKCKMVITTQTISATGHSYSVTRGATCGSAGSKKCSKCGATASIPATGNHNYSVVTTAATCTTAGTKKCSGCSATTSIASLGHNYSVITRAATCTTAGTKKCSRCTATNSIAATGHTTSTRTIQPTCGANGKVEEYCTKCNASISTISTIPATGKHTYTVTKAATCTTTGSKKCNNCATTATIPLISHTTSTRTTPPTCGENGKNETYCTKCDTVVSSTTIPSTGNHDYVITKKATCLEKGTKECNNCASVATIPITGHSYKTTTEPTCGRNGEKTCSICFVTEAIPATGNHTPTTIIKKEATCEEEGIAEAYCSGCNKSFGTTTIPATGIHDIGTKITSEATCKKTGIREIYCKVCDKVITTETIAIDKDNHVNTATEEKVAPTCDKTGVKITSCKDCNAIIKTEQMPLLGHDYKLIRTVSCGYDGEKECSRCHLKLITPATGQHTPGRTEVEVEPTCTEKGVKIQYCSGCSFEMGRLEIPIKGHSYKTIRFQSCGYDGKAKCEDCGLVKITPASEQHTPGKIEVEVEPTCTETGVKAQYCNGCGLVIRRMEIPARHTEANMEVQKATEETEGIRVVYCIICHETLRTEKIPKVKPQNEEVKDRSVCEGKDHVLSGPLKTDGSGLAHFRKCENCNYWYYYGECHPVEHYYILMYKGEKNTIRISECTTCGYSEALMAECSFHDTAYEADVREAVDFLFDLLGDIPSALKGIYEMGAAEYSSIVYGAEEGRLLDDKYSIDDLLSSLGQFTLWDLEDPKYSSYKDNAATASYTYPFRLMDNDELLSDEDLKYASGYNETFTEVEDYHDIATRVTTEPTCQSDGLREVYCKDCGRVFSSTVIKSTGTHNIDSKVTTEPTCQSDGLREIYCKDCGRVFETITEKTTGAHTYEVKRLQTCGTDGLKQCKYCNKEMVLYATGNHFPGEAVETEATCMRDGEKIIYCKSCNMELSRVKLTNGGHDYKTIRSATCNKDGLRRCSRCLQEIVLKATGNHTPYTKVNVTTKEIEGVYCSSCNTKLSEMEGSVDISDYCLLNGHRKESKFKSDGMGYCHIKKCNLCNLAVEVEECVIEKHYYDVFDGSDVYTVCISKCEICGYEGFSMLEQICEDPDYLASMQSFIFIKDLLINKTSNMISDLVKEEIIDNLFENIPALGDMREKVERQFENLNDWLVDKDVEDVEEKLVTILKTIIPSAQKAIDTIWPEYSGKAEKFEELQNNLIEEYKANPDSFGENSQYNMLDLNDEAYAEEIEFAENAPFVNSVNVTDDKNMFTGINIDDDASVTDTYLPTLE